MRRERQGRQARGVPARLCWGTGAAVHTGGTVHTVRQRGRRRVRLVRAAGHWRLPVHARRRPVLQQRAWVSGGGAVWAVLPARQRDCCWAWRGSMMAAVEWWWRPSGVQGTAIVSCNIPWVFHHDATGRMPPWNCVQLFCFTPALCSSCRDPARVIDLAARRGLQLLSNTVELLQSCGGCCCCCVAAGP